MTKTFSWPLKICYSEFNQELYQHSTSRGTLIIPIEQIKLLNKEINLQFLPVQCDKLS